MTKKKYELTPEHRARLPEWRDKWIANAMSTKPMDDEEREITRKAILGMYSAAKLDAPKAIVFVPSPFVLRFAGGFAAWWWHQTNEGKSVGVPAGTDFTAAATRDALAGAQPAKRPGRKAASKVDEIDLSNWYVIPYVNQIRAAAKQVDPETNGPMQCAVNAYSMWNGGNQWSGYVSYLSFFRHVAQLDLDYSAWDHYEKAAIHSGPRIVHKDFAMVSDRPSVLTVDAENRPHNETGPFCAWRDGTGLFAWHGVRVPAWVILHPERITVDLIDAEQNAEVRRVMLERFGEDRYLENSKAQLVSKDAFGELYRRELAGDEPLVMVKVLNSTPEPDGSIKTYWLRVPPTIQTAHEAVAWTGYMTPGEYKPELET